MTTIDLVDDSSSEGAEAVSPPTPPPTRPSRPKLRTRRAIAYHEEEDEEDDANPRDSDDVEMRIALPPRQASAPVSGPRGRATRARKEPTEAADATYEEDDEDEEEEEEDDDMDDFVDDEEEEEEEEEEIVGRRRSSRTRTSVRHREAKEEDDDDDEAEFKMQVQLAKRQSAAAARRVSRTVSSGFASGQATPSRKRKRPQNGGAKPKSKPRGRRDEDEDEYVKHKSESDSENDEWLMSEVEAPDKGAESDEMDENAFVVEKILARETHTRKGWTRLRENRTTRFLQNGSIFIDDEDEDENKDDAKKKDGEDQPAADDVVVVVDGPQQQEEREEERFLIKWKNLSYIHVSWETEKNLLEVDRMVKGKIQRFREKEQLGLLADRMQNGDEYFNPEFRDVDRILDIQDKPGDKYTPVDDDDEDEDDDGEEEEESEGDKKTKKKLKFMLIKWKAQPYDALTWEREDDVHDDAAVQEYEKRLERAAMRYKRMSTSKPSRSKSRKIPKFRGYSTTNRPPFKEGLENMALRDYQLTGVNWMLLNWYQRRNSMLADEMGLGKTLQTVTYVNHLAIAEELPGPYLIVAPLSTLGHWQREFANWTNLNAVVYHGSADARKMIQEFEFFLSADEYKRVVSKDASGKGGKLPKPVGGTCYRFDVLITTFEMCSAPDFAKLARVKWQLLVVDEAHRLKNRNSKLTTTIKKNFAYENILLLTGTPLQNNVEELWTLLHMLDEERFDSMDEFMLDYGELKDMSQVEKLHGELKPFLLRRMKEDVEKSLAPKEETIIEVELTVLQKQYYRAIYEQNTEFLARGMKRSQAPSLMNVLMELRKCCNHPFLIRGMEQREIARLREKKEIAREEIERQAVELLVTASGKLILLDKLLPRLKENGHRVLIFSQFKIMLDILQDYLRLRAYRCERIDGNITGNDRQAAIDRFCDPGSQAFIMLLSTRAGGVGINLTAADTVIIYDSDWNPQNDLQAQARCHRIGQKKSVKIYRLLTAKTYELHMFHQASLKLGLDQAVLGSIRDQQNGVEAVGKTKRPNAQMSKDEIENLLKHGAYEMFKEDKDGEAEAASKRFSEESIDQILSRSTKIIHDPKAQADEDGGNGKKSIMSSFSKATFVSSDDPNAQVALDDPDFWTKVVGLQVPEKVEPSPLKKRRCRVKTYLQEESADENEKAPKKRGRGRPTKEEHEEFVISSSSDDDDDDDDENDSVGTDELDDFEPGNKKSKKQKKTQQGKSNNLPIYLFQDRIGDLLTTYGYGRWDDMVASFPQLRKYTREELVKFTRAYIISLVRVAATSLLLSKQIPPQPAPQPGQAGMPPQPPVTRIPATKEQLADWLDGFANKFRIVGVLLTELSTLRFSHIPIASVGLPHKAANSKAEREATAKLQHIERMLQLQTFVRAQIGPIEPMMELLGRFPKDMAWIKVQDMIMKGEVPPPLPGADQTTIEEVKAQPVAEASSTEAPPSVSTEGETKEVEGEKQVDAPEAPAVTSTEATTDEEQKAQEKSDEKSDDVADGEAEDAEKLTQEPPADTTEAKASEEATEEPKSVQAEAAASTSETETKRKAEDGVKPATSNVPAIETSTETPTTRSVSPAKPAISDEQLRLTMSRLQALPDVGSPLSVAPWWISIVDDVLLLLYIHKHGWMKGRIFPAHLARDDSLFGSRAAPYETIMWPNVFTLNKRVRTLLSTWTNTRRLSAQANAILMRRRLNNNPQPSTAPVLAGRVLVPPPLPPGMAVPPARHTAPFHSAPLNSSQADPPQVSSGAYVSEPTQDLAKRGRFAKLVYSFGIPNTRLCTTDHTRFQKWRYFLSDELLNVSNCTLVELQAEAEDLERFCRLRAAFRGEPSEAPLPPMPKPRVRSILGSRHGDWGILSHAKCRRLAQRIDLFHNLRTQLLCLPSKTLVSIVNEVLDEMNEGDPTLASQYPSWWHAPHHDMYLLQGVECHGLDDKLSRVWKLKQFVEGLASGVYPSATWVENHVQAIVTRANRLIMSYRETMRKHHEAKAERQRLRMQQYQLSQQQQISQHLEQQRQRIEAQLQQRHQQAYIQQQRDAQRQRQQEQVRRQLHQEQPAVSEARQRIRDIQGMRSEDSHYSDHARLRMIMESHANAKAAKMKAKNDEVEMALAAQEEVTKTPSSDSSVGESQQTDIETSAREMTDALKEVRQMKQEDPYFSTRVSTVWLEQRKQDLADDKAKKPGEGGTPASSDDATDAATASVEEKTDAKVEDAKCDEDGEVEVVDEIKGEVDESTPPSQPNGAEATSPKAATNDNISPQKITQLSSAGATSASDDDADAEVVVMTPAKAPAPASGTAAAATDDSPSGSVSSSGQKRKRVPRAWEVIVIDDSDDDEEESAPVAKHTTRSRRRRRGDSLVDGL